MKKNVLAALQALKAAKNEESIARAWTVLLPRFDENKKGVVDFFRSADMEDFKERRIIRVLRGMPDFSVAIAVYLWVHTNMDGVDDWGETFVINKFKKLPLEYQFKELEDVIRNDTGQDYEYFTARDLMAELKVKGRAKKFATDLQERDEFDPAPINMQTVEAYLLAVQHLVHLQRFH